ncbi:MAG TPA: OmpA family protein [Pyrinomonadaceae bacterium]|jgi:flagellar motor protein MotB|nr:OmpA family protein [Pyrinomonadaceae bacterium]
MRLRHLNESEIDVWPAFTDFLTSVLIIVVIFVFGILFSNIARSMVRRNSEFEDMQLRQQLVRRQLQGQLGEKSIEMSENGSLQHIILRVNEEGSGGVLFSSGRADLGDKGKELLTKIAGVLIENSEHYDKIQVEGHTDDVPVGGIYASNWELSAARAGAVVKFILDESKAKNPPGLEPWRFSASGAAEYHPYGVDEKEMKLERADNPRGGPPLNYVVVANQPPNRPPGVNPRTDTFERQRNRRIEIILTYRVKGTQ